SQVVEQNCSKEFYVSPFLGMDMSYAFRVQLPHAGVGIAIHGKEQNELVIAASLSGVRMELSDGALLKVFVRYPLLTLKVIAAIHWHALRLWLRGFCFHAHESTDHFSITVADRRTPSS